MPIPFESDDPERPSVSCRVVVQHGAVHRLALPDSQGLTPHERDIEIEAMV